ncbi:signal transduction histidine kinase [Solirubrobacter pauli]|uniref:histidine kinase n=1 Tax=Solirubrobacter pauli TaxID=166793 RepID=A0A660LCE0_9ACTN|nr:sensor histidine kinase [Solirubrobacter pauli]RKQ92249.1 signal transduction histidine kinase [Solirubrobacter pauli]
MRIDLGVAAALAAAITLTITGVTEPGSEAPDAVAYLLGLAASAWVLLRRASPLGALIGTILTLVLYYDLGYPAFSPAVALTPTAFFAALAGRAVPAACILGLAVVFSTGWRVLADEMPLDTVLGTNSLADVALFAAVIVLGEAVRSRRSWGEEVRARERLEAEQRAEEERLRIARELHDVMAHTIVGVSVQASVAADVIDDSPEAAKEALRAIRAQSTEAMAELRAVVGVLREGDQDTAPRAPAPGLDGLAGLVELTHGAGVEVAVAVDGTARPLPKAIDMTAYRIIQESLTNVIRHARTPAARVHVRYDPAALVLEIADDGVGGTANGSGHGVLGMRERAAAVGGTLTAERAPEGGFRVRATLPTP